MKEIEEQLEKLKIIPSVGEVFHPLSNSEISQIEFELEYVLPNNYKWFLMKYGTSAFEEYIDFKFAVDVPLHISETGTGNISHFFGSSDIDYGETLTLKWNIETYKGRMPRNLIPIGSDGGGDLICLGIAGEEMNKVYYWDHTNEWDEEDVIQGLSKDIQFGNLYFISENFDDFLMSLNISDDD